MLLLQRREQVTISSSISPVHLPSIHQLPHWSASNRLRPTGCRPFGYFNTPRPLPKPISVTSLPSSLSVSSSIGGKNLYFVLIWSRGYTNSKQVTPSTPSVLNVKSKKEEREDFLRTIAFSVVLLGFGMLIVYLFCNEDPISKGHNFPRDTPWENDLHDYLPSATTTSSPLFHRWDESSHYILSRDLFSRLRSSSQVVVESVMKTLDRVLQDDNYFAKLNVPDLYWDTIRKSWNRKDQHFCSRFDFIFEGQESEYTTPTTADPLLLEISESLHTIVETAVIQHNWRMKYPGDLYNKLPTELLAFWESLYNTSSAPVSSTHTNGSHNEDTFSGGDDLSKIDHPVIYFLPNRDDDEELAISNLMAQFAQKAGFSTRTYYTDQIKWNGEYFEDPDRNRLQKVWKSNPWKWILSQTFTDKKYQQHLEAIETLHWIEPLWKTLITRKEFLPLLYELSTSEKKNIIPTFFTPQYFRDNSKLYIEKKLQSNDYTIYMDDGRPFDKSGQNSVKTFFNTLRSAFTTTTTTTPSTTEEKTPAIYQEWINPLEYDENKLAFSVWVVGNRSSPDMAIRTETGFVFTDESHVVPHTVIFRGCRLSFPYFLMRTFFPPVASNKSGPHAAGAAGRPRPSSATSRPIFSRPSSSRS